MHRARYRPVVLAMVLVTGLGSIVSIFGYTSPVIYGVEAPINLLSYWHIALAWAGSLALFVTFLASVQFLRVRDRSWNLLAGASAESGLLMLTATIGMGSLWGSEIWGVYWSWGDVRLVTIFVAWFVYVGYLVVFASTVDGEQRYAAIYGIVGFATIPLSYLSTRLWNPELHAPTIDASSGPGVIEPVPLVLSIAAFTLLYVYLVTFRTDLFRMRDAIVDRTSVR